MTCKHCSTLAKANREMADRTIAAERKVEALLMAVQKIDKQKLLFDLRREVEFKRGAGYDHTQERLAINLIECSGKCNNSAQTTEKSDGELPPSSFERQHSSGDIEFRRDQCAMDNRRGTER